MPGATARKTKTSRKPGTVATVRRKALKASRLGIGGWFLLARSFWWVTVAFVGLRVVGYSRCVRALVRRLREPVRSYDADRLGELASSVDIASRNHVLTVTCLPRSMALLRLARAEGFPAEVRIGVDRPEESSIRAHAWVEVEGQVVGDRQDIGDEFARLERHLRGG